MRLRVTFAKTEAMRYTSHLDLFKTWERTMRRAGLPLLYSQGYNPHPKMHLASALPLGFTSQCEILDAWLKDTSLTIPQIQAILQPALPPGIQVLDLAEVDSLSPPLQTQVRSAEYMVTLLDQVPELARRFDALLSATSLPSQKRGKTYDLRPLIQTIEMFPLDNQERQRFLLRLIAQEGRTGRPEDVLAVLGIYPEATIIHRTKLILW